MKRFTVLLALVALFSLGGEVRAQEAGSQDVRQELRTLVAEESPADADRAEIADFLQREDVEQAAAERGIDLERVRAGVRTLDAGEAGTLAEKVRDVDAALAGGDTLVITTTTIIIILLILLIIAVA